MHGFNWLIAFKITGTTGEKINCAYVFCANFHIIAIKIKTIGGESFAITNVCKGGIKVVFKNVGGGACYRHHFIIGLPIETMAGNEICGVCGAR